MKAKYFILLLPLFFIFQTLSSQTSIHTIPNRLDFESGPGITQIQLEFEGDPLPWTAEVDGEWLTIDPSSGTGSTVITIQHEINNSYRRKARITFSAPGEEFDPIIMELTQYQAMPLSMMPVEFSIMEFEFLDDQKLLPYTALASFKYEPVDSVLFFSMLVRKDAQSEAHWVIQNIALPEKHWHDSIQPIATRFDLGLLGYEHGDDVSQIEYSYAISGEPDTADLVLPDNSFDLSHFNSKTNNAVNREADDLHVPDTILTYTPMDWIFPIGFDDNYYIGCSMPNGDLDALNNPLDQNGCVPASATNSLKWLSKKHDEIDFPPSWQEGFKQLAGLMGHKGNGVIDPNFLRGKLDIVEAYNLPIKVKYQDGFMNGDVASTSGNSSAESHGAGMGKYPTKEWMINEIKNGEDVEINIEYPSGNGHCITLTGTYTILGNTAIYYKHDVNQHYKEPSSLLQEHSWINVTDGKMTLVNEGNAFVDMIVSESFDPDYQADPASETLGKYCKSFKRTIPPGTSLKFTFPENDKRCFNTTVRVLNRSESDSYKKVAEWNFNSGKTRTFKNDTDQVITVEIHNDDKFDGGEPLKNFQEYIIDIDETRQDPAAVTDPDNSEEYAGFSIGTDDDSFEEFGDLEVAEVVYVDSIGTSLYSFPQKLSSDGVKKIKIQREITTLNRYWNSLGLVLGIDSIGKSAPMKITCPSTGYSQTLEFVDYGEFEFPLGGVTETGTFELEIELEGDGEYFFDNIGIPSLVQVEPILEISDQTISLDTYLATSDTVEISNPGGTDLIWYIEHDADWLTTDPVNGINETTVLISANENPVNEVRTAVLTITGPNARNSPATITVSQPASTASIDLEDKSSYALKVYPNPNTGEFEINLTGLEPGDLILRLNSILGKEVWTMSTTTGEHEWHKKVSIENLKKGIYFLSVDSGQGRLRQSVIIR